MEQLLQILDEINSAPTPKDKKASLTKHRSEMLIGVLQAHFDKRIEFDLPEGTPPIDEGAVYTRPLYRVINYLPQLIKGNGIDPQRKQKIFMKGLMQTQPADVREFIVALKDGKFSELYPNIDAKSVKAVYPQCFAPK